MATKIQIDDDEYEERRQRVREENGLLPSTDKERGEKEERVRTAILRRPTDRPKDTPE